MCMAHGILSERVGCYVGKRRRMGREGEEHHAEAGRPAHSEGGKKRGKREKKEKEKTRPDRWAWATGPGKEKGREHEKHGWARLLLGRWTGPLLVLLS